MTTKNIQEFYPLSPMQQGMFFHSLYAPDSGVYVEQLSCILHGALDTDAFERAWQRVTDHHSILRTAFIGQSLKEPIQVVHQKIEIKLERKDWRGLDADGQEARLRSWLDAHQRQGFDLAQAPLMRLGVAQLADNATRFIWSYHHILLDGWSMPLLLNEVFALYDAYRQGRDLPLEPTPPFRDYIAWLRQQDMGQAEAYWRRLLAGFSAPTPLIMDRATSDENELLGQFADQEIYLDEDTTRRLGDFARANRLTLNTIVQGAWALLLSRYSGEQDVLFGATVSGRPPELAGAEFMVGLFINTLPVRVRIAAEKPTVEWLQELQAQQLEMRRYEYSPLVDIQGWSDVPRKMSLFESILVFENYPVQPVMDGQQGILELEDVRSVEQTNYPLNLIVGAADRLMLRIAFDRQQFDTSTIDRMLGHLSRMLQAMANSPNQPVSSLPLLQPQEEHQILVEWNQTQRPFPRTLCAHQIFEQQVRETPNAVAVRFEGKELSYDALNRRANQLAHALLRQNVVPETLVAICAEPSFEMIIGILGVLKAGGAYVPLDPTYPQDRLAFMLQDCGAPVLLAQQKLIDYLPRHAAQTVCLDTDWPSIAEESDENLDVALKPDNLAYVIYTSGSTGRPKGTLLEHHGLCNLVWSFTHDFDIGRKSRVLLFFSFGFDGSVADIFPSLLSGATLCLAPRETVMSMPDLHQFLKDERCTHAAIAPSALGVMSPDDLADLRTVLSAGERCTPETVAKWLPGRRMVNAYGPTEATVGTTWHHVSDHDKQAGSIPIGRPIANARVYILDGQRRPVPIGVAGELYIGGEGVARGYLNRPDLTAERFIPDPFSNNFGDRLYRTGDLTRYLPDGNIEFLGRIDHQVKIRGFRIELGEIETALERHPDVQQAVALAREDDPGNKRLVAYIQTGNGQQVRITDLRKSLQQTLPDYMIPSAFVTMPRLPLTPNGKVDRQALPQPDKAQSGLEDSYVAPRDAMELQISQIWENILRVERAGVTDSFFDLGGHSLLAVRIIAQIEQQLGKTLSLVDLFQMPTVEQLATILRSHRDDTSEPLLVPLQPGNTKPPLYLVHPSGGSVHWYGPLARRLPKGQPVYGIQARGTRGDSPIDTRIEDMAARYVREIRTTQPQGPYSIGSWSFGVIVAFEMAQQLVVQGQQVALLAILDQGPLIPSEEPKNQAEYLLDTFGEHIDLSLAQLADLSKDDQVTHVFEKAKEIKWLLPDVTLEQFRQFVHILQTHTNAWRDYTPRPYPGRVTLFRAAKRPEDEHEQQTDLGWAKYALGGVEISQVPGDHLSMMAEPRVRALAKALAEHLD